MAWAPHPLRHAASHLVEFLILQHAPRARAKRRAALQALLRGTAPAQQLPRVLQEIDALHLNRTGGFFVLLLVVYLSVSPLSVYQSIRLSVYFVYPSIHPASHPSIYVFYSFLCEVNSLYFVYLCAIV